MRSWVKSPGGISGLTGVCLPSVNQVRVGTTRSGTALNWPFYAGNATIVTIGKGIGDAEQNLLCPLSFDGCPDGRLFVLDVGAARVKVFHRRGEYLTQWGGRGDARGEFNFGAGSSPQAFGGSIAVEKDVGFVYVLDPGNARIQRFEP